MERRAYFVVGDLVVALTLGALSALVTRLVVSPGWSMWLGMVVGMAVGMALLATVGSALQLVLGGLEVMIPGALSGMITGMVVGMMACTGTVTVTDAATLGAGCGLLVMAFVYGMNAYLTRDGHSWTT